MGEVGQCDKAICVCKLVLAYGGEAPTFLQRLGHRGTVFFDYISKEWLPGPFER